MLDEVATLTRQGLDTRQIADRLDLSWQHVSRLQKQAIKLGMIDRTRYAYGHTRMQHMIDSGTIRRGSVTQILSALDNHTVDYLISRLGKRNSLHHVIVEIINEAARNTGRGNAGGHKGSGGDSR